MTVIQAESDNSDSDSYPSKSFDSNSGFTDLTKIAIVRFVFKNILNYSHDSIIRSNFKFCDLILVKFE